MRKFGTVTENFCEIALEDLTGSENTLPQDSNVYFELFLEDITGELIDVPVVIRNFRDSNGDYPNAVDDENPGIKESWRLVRRFMIYDTLSGIDEVGGFVNYTTPGVVRFAAQVRLRL